MFLSTTMEMTSGQLSKASSSIVSTDAGMTIFFRLGQLLNAKKLIIFTPSGIANSSAWQPINAYLSIHLTEEGILVAPLPTIRELSCVLIIALHPSRLSNIGFVLSTTIVVRLVQYWNGATPMTFILEGMLTDSRLAQA